MGRGIAYPYNHFLLIDESYFQYSDYFIKKETGEHVTKEDQPDLYNELCESLMYIPDDMKYDYFCAEFDDDAFESFKQNAATLFHCSLFQKMMYLSNEASYFAQCDKFRLGIDSSGATPCIFLEPFEYTSGGGYGGGPEKLYNLNRQAEQGFNLLIAQYPGCFSRPTSAYTSEPVTRYKFKF